MDTLEEILEEIENGTADVRHADKLRELLSRNSYQLIADEDMGIFESISYGTVDGQVGWVLQQVVRPGKYQDVFLGKNIRVMYVPTCASCPHWVAMDRLCLKHAINVSGYFFCASHPDIEN
jgi:hypothetical protein